MGSTFPSSWPDEAHRCQHVSGECVLTSWFDVRTLQNVIAHCRDDNPEHWLRIPDCLYNQTFRPWLINRFVRRWLHRLHTWEAEGG